MIELARCEFEKLREDADLVLYRCHIAKRPLPAHERVNEISKPVSDIVMKLLAKTPEERYQMAAGAEADLRKCVADLESFGCVGAFSLGAHDLSDRLRISEKLYGRDSERKALLEAFDRVVASGVPEPVLVSACAGIGKSPIVNELHKALVLPRGIFISGKFDRNQCDILYATIAYAFQGLVRQILAKSEGEISRWRETIQMGLGGDGQLIVNLIPELEFISGKQPVAPELGPKQAQNRFYTVFRRFLGAFGRKEQPLVPFLDDLQWLDAATLKLLEHLVTHPDIRHLLLIGAYRDNEVTPSHRLVPAIGSIGRSGAILHEIILVPLSLSDVNALVADALRCEQEDAEPLARAVHEKTAGNPFFAIQFLVTLVEEDLVRFDPCEEIWRWNLDRIRAKDSPTIMEPISL